MSVLLCVNWCARTYTIHKTENLFSLRLPLNQEPKRTLTTPLALALLLNHSPTTLVSSNPLALLSNCFFNSLPPLLSVSHCSPAALSYFSTTALLPPPMLYNCSSNKPIALPPLCHYFPNTLPSNSDRKTQKSPEEP